MRDLLTDAVEVEYEGPATLGGSGRGRLHDRTGGIGEMLWEALGIAGWVGEMVSIRTTVSLRVGVAAAPETRPKRRTRLEPLAGGARRFGERGWIDDQGVAWQQSVGPLNGRAAGPGYRLSESERRTEELEFGEDLLYTAAVHAGWLSGEPDEVADIPDVRITVSVAPRNRSWETCANSAAPSHNPGAASVSPTGSPGRGSPPSEAQTIGAIDESELLALALDVAVRMGDPNPMLIQHARGTRYEVTRTTGSIVFSDAPSYIVAMQGNFRTRRPSPPRHLIPNDQQFLSYPFQTLVIDTETGQITDSGSSNQCPNLASLGEVVTDHDARE
jgi:hypothetical protein